MSYIKLPFGKTDKIEKLVKLTSFPKNRNADFMFSQLSYLDIIKKTEFQNFIIDIISAYRRLTKLSSSFHQNRSVFVQIQYIKLY